MRRYYIVLFVVFSLNNFVYSQSVSTDIMFEERVHNFGTILEEKGKVSHTFIFKNNGKTSVTINEITSGCGCIGKVLSKDPVKPGSKGKVTISFDPSYKSGFFSKEIVVFSNNNQNYNRIWVEGNIVPAEHPVEDDYPYNFGEGLYLRLKVMAFGYLKPGETKQMQLHYANDTNKEMILDFVARGNMKGLNFKGPGKIGDKAKGIINFSYTMPASNSEEIAFYLDPYVNNKKLTETLQIRILNEDKRKQNVRSTQKK